MTMTIETHGDLVGIPHWFIKPINIHSLSFYPPETRVFMSSPISLQRKTWAEYGRVTQQGEGQSALHDDLVAHPLCRVPDANHLGFRQSAGEKPCLFTLEICWNPEKNGFHDEIKMIGFVSQNTWDRLVERNMVETSMFGGSTTMVRPVDFP